MPTHDSGSVPLTIAIITVSTSRSGPGGAQVDDRSGTVIAEAAVAAGHRVEGRSLVPDDPAAIDKALGDAIGGPAQVIVLTGGTGISARDCTPAVVRARLDRELPGFGELFRMLSFEQVGSKAMLSTAVGGVGGGKAIFALPGAPRACTLAMERLILPEIGHLLAELQKELPLATSVSAVRPVAGGAAGPGRSPPAAAGTHSVGASRPPPRHGAVAAAEQLDEPAVVPNVAVPAGISVTVAPDAARTDAPPIASGWEAALRSLFGTVERGQPEIPEALLRVQPVVDVLNSAGTRAIVRLADGREYGAWGFPDLARRGSKVLLVREAEPLGEIVALHRWPNLAGLCAEGGGLLPDADLALASFTEDRTGRAFEGGGRLFAADGKVVWISDGRRVFRWDATRSEAAARAGAEPISSALATLVLGWSGR